MEPGGDAHTFDPSTREAEVGGALSELQDRQSHTEKHLKTKIKIGREMKRKSWKASLKNKTATKKIHNIYLFLKSNSIIKKLSYQNFPGPHMYTNEFF